MTHLNPHLGLTFRSKAPLSLSTLFARRLAFGIYGASALVALCIAPQMSKAEATAAVTDASSPVVELSKYVVSEDKQIDNVAIAAVSLNQIAGGFNLIDSKDFEQGRVATAADALKLQPGVFAQASGGQDAIKISIRGSGVNRGTGFFRGGVYFEFDGLPLTGPGGTPFELLEPLGVNHIEVLKGGNGFNSGALALGGSINYVTNTGYDSPGNLVRVEAGSFGYVKAQVSTGAVVGQADYYATIIGSVRQGFQTHSASKAVGFIGNFGYKISDTIDTRLFIRYRYVAFDNPGALTKAQLKEDPSQGSPLPTGNVKFNSYRVQPGSTWVGDNTTFKLTPDSSLVLGVVYHDYPIQIVTTGSPFTGSSLAPVFNANIDPSYNTAYATTSAYNGGTLAQWWFDDLSAQAKYIRTDEIAGRKSTTTVQIRDTTHVNAGVSTYVNYAASPYFRYRMRDRNFNGSVDAVASISNDLELLPKLTLTAGLAGTYTKRVSNLTLPIVSKYTQNNDNYLYDLGLRFDVTPTVQVFANVNRAVEPANAWAYIAPTNAGSLNIHEQTSNSIEIGSRAQLGIFEGSISLYREDLRNELQTVLLDPTNPTLGTVESNASPTVHQGVELELDATLWQRSGKSEGKNPHDQLTLRQSFTLSNFYFKNDRFFGKNELAGLPRNYYQAELAFEQASGFYASVSAQVASSYYIDYANTFTVDGYVTYNAKIGFAHPKKGWQVYLQAVNIGDKAYASSISPTYNAAHVDTAVSNAGDGFSVFTGVEFHF